MARETDIEVVRAGEAVTEELSRRTGLPVKCVALTESLAEAYATRNEGNNVLPLAVYRDEDLIGFVMIGKGTVGNENESELIKENYSLWRLMLDKKYQGQGLGKQTMDAVMALIRTFPFGKAKKVWLSYEPENAHAREIYRKYGFVENGEMCDDEIVAVYEL